MKIGLLTNIEWPFERNEDLARIAERFGFDQIWINEHPLDWDPFLVLQRLAGLVPGIPLGIGTINPWARHPAVIAASAATLSRATGVPFVLGIGSGAPPLFPPIGIEPANVIAGTEESVRIMRALVAGQESTFSGSVFSTKGAKLTFGPTEQVSVLLGVSGGPKMLKVAGVAADGVIVPAGNHAFYQSVIGEYITHRGQAASTGEASEVVVNGNILVGDGESVEKEARSRLAHSLEYRAKTSAHALKRMNVELEEAKRWANAPEEIPRQLLEESILWGSPENCVTRLRELEALGVTQYVLRFPSIEEAKEVGESVLPLLR